MANRGKLCILYSFKLLLILNWLVQKYICINRINSVFPWMSILQLVTPDHNVLMYLFFVFCCSAFCPGAISFYFRYTDAVRMCVCKILKLNSSSWICVCMCVCAHVLVYMRIAFPSQYTYALLGSWRSTADKDGTQSLQNKI